MSIIHDALKKAQANLEKNDQKESQEPAETTSVEINEEIRPIIIQTDPQEKKKKGWFSPFVALTCGVLIVGSFLLVILFNILKQSPITNTSSNGTTSKTPAPVSSDPPTSKLKPPPKRVYDQNTLVLNGTMMMGEKRVALINGDIFEIGQTVNGRRIINITLKKVDLLKDGEITTLTVHK